MRRRSARGTARRDALVRAAGDLLLEQGFAAVSHRAVAQRAALPLAATTYYFASLQDLLAQALTELAARWFAAAEQAVAELPARLAGPGPTADAVLQILGLPGAGPAGLLTMYERYVEAARHPGLRTVVAAFNSRVEDLVAEVLRRGGLAGGAEQARLVLAVADGALLRALAEGVEPGAAAATLEHLLAQLAAGPV